MKRPLRLLGKLIFLHSIRTFQKGLSEPWATQQKCLTQILQRNRRTQFGKQHKFQQIRSPERFQYQVPITTYNDMEPFYDKISQGTKNVLFPDPVVSFLITSGTTGRPKLFPLSTKSLALFKRQDMLLIGTLLMRVRRADALSTHIFTFSAPEVLPLRKGCYPVGYITGVIANQLPWFLSRLNRTHPSQTVLNCPDWKAKLHNTAIEVIQQDIRVMFGMPSNLVAFLRNLVHTLGPQLLTEQHTPAQVKFHLRQAMKNGELDLNRLWPAMRFLVYGGVHVEPYLPYLKTQFPQLETLAVYWATEGALGLQFQDSGINLALDTIFFEFIPENQFNLETPLLFPDVKTNTNYRVLITTFGGLYRYDLGDLIRFTRLDPPTIEIVGRAGTVASIAGERLLESQLTNSLRSAMEATNASVSTFTAVPHVTAKKTGYTILIEFIDLPKDLEKFEQFFDRKLRELNFGYDSERQAGVIDQVVVKEVDSGILDQLISKKHSVNGAGKIPLIINPTELEKITLK